MKIAVASQNRKIVTGHAGKCRKFWLYDIAAHAVKEKTLLELPREQSFHEYTGAEPHPLQGIQVLITGGMGAGLARRLAGMGIEGLVTTETDPDRAVAAYLAGTLPLGQPETHDEALHANEQEHP
jgi:predicted Fe-Mo cluster-binding NifX family protein